MYNQNWTIALICIAIVSCCLSTEGWIIGRPSTSSSSSHFFLLLPDTKLSLYRQQQQQQQKEISFDPLRRTTITGRILFEKRSILHSQQQQQQQQQQSTSVRFIVPTNTAPNVVSINSSDDLIISSPSTLSYTNRKRTVAVAVDDDDDEGFDNTVQHNSLLPSRLSAISSSTNLTLVQQSRVSYLNNNLNNAGSDSLSSPILFSSSSSSSSSLSSSNDDILDIISSSRTVSSSILIDVAAQITQSNCQLLGIKSIGVDYGLVRTGLAVTVGYEPKPLAILYDTNHNITTICHEIIKYIQSEQDVAQIIIGLPLHKNGTVATQTNVTIQFGYQLLQHVIRNFGTTKQVLFFDERYTSKEAAARAHSANPNQPLYGTLDADAACIILENYYNDNGLGAYELLIDTQIYNDCLQYYNTMKQIQYEQIRQQNIIQEEKIQRRLRSIQLEKEHAASSMTLLLQGTNTSTCSSSSSSSDGSKKKKKKKKKR